MNIPRYGDNFEKEEPVNINALLTEIKQTDAELRKVQSDFVSLLHELTSSDENIKASLNDFINMMEEGL